MRRRALVALAAAVAGVGAQPQKGAAPATELGMGQRQQLAHILSAYTARPLSAAQAQQLRLALRAAGLPPGPALDEALRAQGLSLKAIDVLAGPEPAASEAASATAPAPRRQVPRPQ